MFRFIVWLIPTLDKFPRSQKFLLGDRMQATALDVLEQLIVATCPVGFWASGSTGRRERQ